MSLHTPSTQRLTDFALGVEHHRLTSTGGVEVDVTNYGATLTAIRVPDRHGRFADVALGFNRLSSFMNCPEWGYFGGVVGRFGNRIRGGKFTLDGVEYELPCNDNANHLHGGKRGFDVRLWKAEVGESDVALTYVSADGEEGYPGELTAKVTYRMGAMNDLHLLYEARVKGAPTIINLTNHTYFNLKGEANGDILDHDLAMPNATTFTAVDAEGVPTGEILPVEGTPFDFRKSRRIGQDIGADHVQLVNGRGYDHNFIFRAPDAPPPAKPELCAIVRESASGRVLRVLTTEPAVQFYSGNFLTGKVIGKSGKPYNYRGGFCLETQRYPDSPNHPHFPSVVLRPGEVYKSHTIFAFSTED